MTDTLISRLAAALRECSDDLEAEIASRYGGSQFSYPSQSARYMRDMAPVERARALLAEWEEKKQRWRRAPEQAAAI
jgi:GGDEF domain-containing protein